MRTGFGLAEDAAIPMLAHIAGVEIDWALGLVLRVPFLPPFCPPFCPPLLLSAQG